MSLLSVYHVSSPELPNKVLTHFEDIASTLAEQGITFERHPATVPIEAGAGPEEVIRAYAQQIDRWMSERGHQAVAVISVNSSHAQPDPLRSEFLEEHQHGADELRFFAAGRGLYSLHIGDFVYAVQCEKNDLMSIPAGTRQWFDMGEQPRLVAIRLFARTDGQASKPTGEGIAGQFPGLDD